MGALCAGAGTGQFDGACQSHRHNRRLPAEFQRKPEQDKVSRFRRCDSAAWCRERLELEAYAHRVRLDMGTCSRDRIERKIWTVRRRQPVTLSRVPGGLQSKGRLRRWPTTSQDEVAIWFPRCSNVLSCGDELE